MKSAVPELKLWRSNLTSWATHFRTSTCRTKALFKCQPVGGNKIRSFSAHHEVRFAEHLHALVNATLRNITACRTVWTSAQKDENETRQKKRNSQGFSQSMGK